MLQRYDYFFKLSSNPLQFPHYSYLKTFFFLCCTALALALLFCPESRTTSVCIGDDVTFAILPEFGEYALRRHKCVLVKFFGIDFHSIIDVNKNSIKITSGNTVLSQI